MLTANDMKIGDIVRFTSAFYSDPYNFVPTYQSHDDIHAKYLVMDDMDYKRALWQVEAVVVSFWDMGVILEYTFLGIQCCTNHFWHEIKLTGEHRVHNNPDSYDGVLL